MRVVLEPAGEERPQPLERDEEDERVRPERRPDEVREHQHSTKEHRQTGTAEIVGDDEANRIRHAVRPPPMLTRLQLLHRRGEPTKRSAATARLA
jgi:hypothetical protein